MSSGRSRISRWGGGGGRRAVGGTPTSDVGAFWQKHMRKRKNWILLGGCMPAAPPPPRSTNGVDYISVILIIPLLPVNKCGQSYFDKMKHFVSGEAEVDLSRKFKGNLNMDSVEYNNRNDKDDRLEERPNQPDVNGRNRKSNQKSKERKPEMEHYSVRHITSSHQKERQDVSRETKEQYTPKTKPKRQDQPIYRPKRTERPSGFDQEIKEQSSDRTESHTTHKSPNSASEKAKRPTQALYTNKFQQGHSPQDHKSPSPISQVVMSLVSNGVQHMNLLFIHCFHIEKYLLSWHKLTELKFFNTFCHKFEFLAQLSARGSGA